MSESIVDKAWWQIPSDDTINLQSAISRKVLSFDTSQKYRTMLNLQNLRLYGGLDATQNAMLFMNMSTSSALSGGRRLKYNVIKSCIDTGKARIAKNRPLPQFLTSGASWNDRQKAKNLSKFIKGEFYRMKVYERAIIAWLHSAVFGTGFLHVFEDAGRVDCEWIYPEEIKVDEAEGVYGLPRSIHRRKNVSRELLVAQFPESKDDILSAKTVSVEGKNTEKMTEQVEVIESWHLPSSRLDDPGNDDLTPENKEEDKSEEDPKQKEKNDGRHVICIDRAILLDEPYERNEFPFVKLTWDDPILGYFGVGIAEQLMSIQEEISRTMSRIQQIFHLVAVPRIFYPVGSNLNFAHMNNEIGAGISYQGSIPPQIVAISGVPPELLQHYNDLIAKAYQLVGISQMSAQSQKPAGLNSGKALREFSDIESERFAIQGQKWEAFMMDIARHVIYNAKKIAERSGKYETIIPDKKSAEKLEWKDVELEEDQYIMQITPVSMLSDTFAGRIADVQDLVNLKIITDPAQIQELIQLPDLESESNVMLASRRNLQKTFDDILTHGKYEQPDPMQDLATGIKLGMLTYLEAKGFEIEDSRLQLLLKWIQQAKEIISPPQPPQPPQPQQIPGGPPQPMPPGMMPPPASPMMPPGQLAPQPTM